MEPSEPVVKPGILSTEFWVTLAPIVYAIADLLKEPPKSVPDAIVRVAAILAIAAAAFGYSNSRSKTKSAASVAKAAESNLAAADMNVRAATMEATNRASRAMG